MEDTVNEFHDLVAEGIAKRLADAPIFEKFVQVTVRFAKDGEVIVTKIAGQKDAETRHTAEKGDIVVTNPSGESYIPPVMKFLQRHKKIAPMKFLGDFEGVWQAYGLIRAIKNPWNKPITINAPWGEPMNGVENCMIATPIDEAGNVLNPNDMYIIAPNEYAGTYRLQFVGFLEKNLPGSGLEMLHIMKPVEFWREGMSLSYVLQPAGQTEYQKEQGGKTVAGTSEDGTFYVFGNDYLPIIERLAKEYGAVYPNIKVAIKS